MIEKQIKPKEKEEKKPYTPFDVLQTDPELNTSVDLKDPELELKVKRMKELDELAKPDKMDTKKIKEIMATIQSEETSLNMID